MSKYIKLEDALKAVRDNTMPLDCGHVDRMRAIRDLPTIEYDDKIKRLENKCENLKQRVRELEKQTKIDRCGDCRHFVKYDGCNQIDYPMEKDDYCSLFQRKKG